MKRTLSNTATGALIGLANTILYTLLFPLYWPFESFVTFFSFDGSFMWVVMLGLGFGAALLAPNIGVGAVRQIGREIASPIEVLIVPRHQVRDDTCKEFWSKSQVRKSCLNAGNFYIKTSILPLHFHI
ncbi:MAG: hypothetical protein JEZ00_08460 [Anaerolineaceae bacterium]|nr:hypothetical protein [Anaerolineaceae bacterium]